MQKGLEGNSIKTIIIKLIKYINYGTKCSSSTQNNWDQNAYNKGRSFPVNLLWLYSPCPFRMQCIITRKSVQAVALTTYRTTDIGSTAPLHD